MPPLRARHEQVSVPKVQRRPPRPGPPIPPPAPPLPLPPLAGGVHIAPSSGADAGQSGELARPPLPLPPLLLLPPLPLPPKLLLPLTPLLPEPEALLDEPATDDPEPETPEALPAVLEEPAVLPSSGSSSVPPQATNSARLEITKG
jgi:hypothetical protein